MKKTGFLTILSIAMALSLTACGGAGESNVPQGSSQEEQSSSQPAPSISNTSSSVVEDSSNSTSSSVAESSSSSASSSSTQSSSSQASSSSIHVHNYGTLNEGYLPSYFYDGMKPYYYCIECGQYFDINKNPTTQDALKLEKAGDSIALLLDGNEKETFNLVEKDETHASWKIENRGVSEGSIVSIAKPGDTTYKYGFSAGDNIDDNYKILIDGQVDFFLTASPNGFSLSINNHEYATLVVKVNDDEYPLNKVTYLENDKETYIYGYHYFNVGDKMTVVDKVNSVTYDFDDLEDDVLWNVYDFEKGTNNEIVFKKQARFGIEFDRGGDKKISITKTFGPSRTFEHCDLAFLDGRGNEVMTETTYASTSLEYEAVTWYLTHEKVVNNQDIVDFLSTNGLTIYFKTVTLKAGERFIVMGFPSTFGVFFDNLVDLRVEEGAISQDGDYIKIMKEGTYEVGYIPCCNSLYIYSSRIGANDAYVMVGGNSYPLTKDADNNVTYTAHFEKNQYAVFMDSAYQLITPNQVGISMGTPAHASSFMIYFDKAGTFTLTLNLDTKNLNVDAVSIDPEDQPSEITSAYLIGSGGLSAKMADDPNNPDLLVKENVAMVASSGMVYVSIYRGDLSGAIDGVTLSPSSADIATSYSTLFYITAGEGTYSFYLNKKSLVLTIVKVS